MLKPIEASTSVGQRKVPVTRLADLSVDLTAVGRTLQPNPRYRNVVDAIARSASARAAKIDLQQAGRYLHKSVAMMRPVPVPALQDNDLGEAIGGFFKLAIILYARATCDASKARRKLRFRDKLSGEDYARHERLIALRDKAIAHDDATDHFLDGPWAQDELVYYEWTDMPSQIGYSWHRTNYRENLVNDLIAALPKAEEVLEAISEKLDHELHAMLIPLAEDRTFALVMHSNQIPPDVDYQYTTLTAGKRREEAAG